MSWLSAVHIDQDWLSFGMVEVCTADSDMTSTGVTMIG